MKIKVCGMRDAENIAQLSKLDIDFMGFIFHQSSPRNFYSDNEKKSDELFDKMKCIPTHISKTGVVVNKDIDSVVSYISSFGLNAIQLHGSETLEYCKNIKDKFPTIIILKAISVENETDILATQDYEDKGIVDYFLFDTKTPIHGGSGIKFNWTVLDKYTGNIPFFLSGGIDSSMFDDIKEIEHSGFVGIDLNSKFETQPGFKDINVLKEFINNIKS